MRDKFEYRIIGNGCTKLLIELGIGCSFDAWLNVIDAIKNDYTIIVYHRLGYGSSSNPKSERTTKNIAIELHNFLSELNINRFVMVGHSFGGLCTIQFAKMYPEMIRAIVLVDSTSFNWKKLYELDNPIMNKAISIDFVADKFLNEGQTTIGNEFKYFEASANNIKSINSFPNVPLTVIARDKEVSVDNFVKDGMPREEAMRYEDVWRELQVELSNLSPQGRLVIANGSDHEVHIEKPDIIINCLKELKNK